MKTVVWFRRDLRIVDNVALYHATQKYNEIFPIYINDQQNFETLTLGGATKVWLHYALTDLNKSLGNNLSLFNGDALSILKKFLKDNEIGAIFFNKVYEKQYLIKDAEITTELEKLGIKVHSFNSSYISEPGEILKDDKSCYKVFTPYYKASLKKNNIRKCFVPSSCTFLKIKNSCNLDDFALLPTGVRWDEKIIKGYEISEQAALKKLENFIQNDLINYEHKRDFPSLSSTSILSPYLHFGQISAVQIWHKVIQYENIEGINCERFLSELIWRDFFAQILYFYPDLHSENMKTKFNEFKWEHSPEKLKAWQQGKTGFPLIDAGMRELRQTGFMHNRVRMICASFCVKNLLIDWRIGAAWFWDNLFDADLASNSGNWQWVAGSGTDAAPYFRIFNPVTQAQRFDESGEYVKKFVPELKDLPNKYIFEPWKAPSNILIASGINIGEDYPAPIVDLNESRVKALSLYHAIA